MLLNKTLPSSYGQRRADLAVMPHRAPCARYPVTVLKACSQEFQPQGISASTGQPLHNDAVSEQQAQAARALRLGRRQATAALLAAWPLMQLVPSPAPVYAAEGSSELVFFDVKIDGESAGRLVVQLFNDVAPKGAARFKELAEERGGVGYRLSKFTAVYPTYIKNAGVASLSYSADERSPISGGDSLDALEDELSRQTLQHDTPGLVSLIVKEATERPTKERLVAINGKLVTVTEQAPGEAPNGTQWTITRSATPELDTTNLIIGKVVSGMDGVIATIEGLKINQPQYDNPYFKAGKAMGDKRAAVAEKAFYRPFKRVVISNCGVVAQADAPAGAEPAVSS